MFIDAARVQDFAAGAVGEPNQAAPAVGQGRAERAPLGLLPLLVAGIGVLVLVGPSMAPYDQHLSVAAPLQAPGPSHWLGTNDIGQDVLSQWLFSARTTLVIALAVTALATPLAWCAGLTAGLSARAEVPILALVDLLLALPALPLYMLVLTLIGPSRLNVALLLGALGWPIFARVVRAQVITTGAAGFVEAAACLGASPLRIATRHILPATLTMVPAQVVLTLRFAVFAEATLAFLGLGEPSDSSWGSMLGWAFANPLLFTSPAWTWLVLPPALGIAALLLVGGWLLRRIGTRG